MVEQLGGAILSDLSIIHAFAAQLPAGAIETLASNSAVRWISLDAPVTSSSQSAKKAPTPASAKNYYLETLRHNELIKSHPSLTGQGIGVAVIDSGISTSKDFSMLTRIPSFNPLATSDNDKYGHGSHVGGIIAGNGYESGGLLKGIAPGVNLIALKISDDVGRAYESDTVKAIQWIYENRAQYNIRVVNLSINSTAESSYHTSPFNAAVEVLWFNGIVVVTSSGNKGGGLGGNTANAAPANDPFIITVGAADERSTTSRSDDTVANYTAFGTTRDGHVKPELVAPGSNIYSVLSSSSDWGKLYPSRVALSYYFVLSGTSMAAPMVTAAVALLLQDEPNLTPDQVKYRLINTGSQIVVGGNGSNQITASYLDINAAVNGTTTQSANTGLVASQLFWSGDNPVAWNSVNWNSVNWNSVNWNSVNWNSVNWNSVNWNSAVLENSTSKRAGVDDENADEPTWEVPAWPSAEETNPDETETPSVPWQPQYRVFVPMVNR